MLDLAEFQSAKILVVDDQEQYTRLMESILRSAGYVRVYTTNDSRAVATMYADIRPDLVVLDISMPHLDGFEVMKQLAVLEREAWLPVLVVSGEDESETLVRALKAGARDFLGKPFDKLEVLTRIRGMLEVRLLHNKVKDHNRELEEKVRERTAELRDTQFDVIRRLGRCAEYRDDATGNHIQRVSRLCERLGRAAGMSAAEAEVLRDASAMHDIGKVGIPDAILRKPGKLTPEEWEVMKSHTVIGANLLSGGRSPLLILAEQIAISHHEKWDGSGYPMGVRGGDIPQAGRITAVCDVFDALTSERPYKVAWPVVEARAEIEAQSGRHFDPEVVGLFVANWADVEAIHAYYQDGGAGGARR